jgi:secreted protein with Ig-like and vWFA domain
LTYKNDAYSGAIDVYDLIKYLLPAYVSNKFCFFVADLLSIVLFDLSEFYF